MKLNRIVTDDIKQFCIRFFLWFLVMLPLSPSTYAVYMFFPSCLWDKEENSCQMLPMIIFAAPFIVIGVPITHEDEDPPSIWPAILLTAFCMTLISFVLFYASKYLSRRTARGPKNNS